MYMTIAYGHKAGDINVFKVNNVMILELPTQILVYSCTLTDNGYNENRLKYFIRPKYMTQYRTYTQCILSGVCGA